MDIECQAIDDDFHDPRGIQYAGKAHVGARYIRYQPVQGVMIGPTARFEQQQETRQVRCFRFVVGRFFHRSIPVR